MTENHSLSGMDEEEKASRLGLPDSTNKKEQTGHQHRTDEETRRNKRRKEEEPEQTAR